MESYSKKKDLRIHSKCQLTDFFLSRQVVQLQRLNNSCRLRISFTFVVHQSNTSKRLWSFKIRRC